jgi:hypothetical protein
MFKSRPGSVVGIATGYVLDGSGIESSLLRDTEEEGSCDELTYSECS